MKKLFIVGILLLSVYNGFSQESFCRNDSINLQTQEYRGEHFWQQSANGADWTRISGETSRELTLIALESMYYRYEVLDGTCNPYFSDILQVIVNQPPIVILEDIDSICINTNAFILRSGSPIGGEYWGNGVSDGKFVASSAGVGIHNYFYSYQNPETTCSDTASATIEVLPQASEANAGNDMDEIVQDSVQLKAIAPSYGQGTWSIATGEGGYFSDINDPQSWFRKGAEDTQYTLVWTVENYCDSNSDDINLTFLRLSSNPCPGTPVVFDADGNMYPTVQIGEQCWFGENMRVGTTITSTETNRAHSDLSDNGIFEKYLMDNDESNLAKYGGLYDWDEMMDYSNNEGAQGICPEGWHIPSLEEWDELDHFYKDRAAGGHLKEGGDSGFEGKLAGDRHSYGFFVSKGSSGFFWASSTYTYDGADEGWIRELCACTNAMDRIHFNKKTGASVRCIKDR